MPGRRYTRDMDRRGLLDEVSRRFDLLAVYLFGSRADEGYRRLGGEPVAGSGSDLDVGVFFQGGRVDVARLGALQAALEDVFAPLRVDLVPLDRVDPLFQFAAVDGVRVAAPDSTVADAHELLVMRRAADLLPFQRELENERFGVATT